MLCRGCGDASDMTRGDRVWQIWLLNYAPAVDSSCVSSIIIRILSVSRSFIAEKTPDTVYSHIDVVHIFEVATSESSLPSTKEQQNAKACEKQRNNATVP